MNGDPPGDSPGARWPHQGIAAATDRLIGAMSAPRVRITQEESRLLQEVIQEYCGVAQGITAGFFLERRLGPRLDTLGLSSYLEYYHYLRYDPRGEDELEELVERITTHETYFFRESYQLDAFTEELAPRLAHDLRDRKKISVWSAGCSTGEEVYTLAILMLECAALRGWNLRVVGSDISRKVLAHARQAVYGPNSFRTTPESARRKYFVAQGDGRLAVRDDVRAICSFGQLNLLSRERFRVIGPCDVIFCRNVLMYLSPDARRDVVEAFYDRLSPGGYLLLGHSESLLNLSTRFDLAHLERDLVYRKPPGDLSADDAALKPRPRPISRPLKRRGP